MLTRVEAALLRVSAAVAVLGGIVLAGLAVTTVHGIVGRALPDLPLLRAWRPMGGHFELVEMGSAVAIFAFLPYTQMKRGHVRVESFTARLGPRPKAILSILADGLLSAILLLVTWRMAIGTTDLYTAPYTRTTMLLGLPLWWGRGLGSLFMFLFTLTALVSVWRSAVEFARGGGGEGP